MASPLPEFTLPVLRRKSASEPEEELDFSKALPPPQPSVGFLPNLYRGAKRGVISDLPAMVGRGIQALADDQGSLEQFGKGIRERAEARGQQPDLRTDSMWGEGAAAFGPMLPVIGGTVAGGMAGGPVGAVLGATAGAMGLFGTSAFQETKEAVTEAGGTPEEAKRAGQKAAVIQGGGETAATLALGPGARIARGMVKAGAKGGIEGTLKQFAKPSNLKDLGKFAAVEYPTQIGTEVAQDYGQAAVEKAAGVDVNPYEQAAAAAGPAFAMTTLLGPFAMGSIHRTNQRRQQLLSTINDPAIGKDNRSRALMEVYQDLKAVDPDAALKWRLDAEVALTSDKPIDVTAVSDLATTASEVRAEQRFNRTPTKQLVDQATAEATTPEQPTASEQLAWKLLLQQQVPGYLPEFGQEPPTEAEQRDINRVVQGPNYAWEQPGLFAPEQLEGLKRVVKAPPPAPVAPDQQTLGDKFAAPAATPPAATPPSPPARSGAAPFRNEQEARSFRAWNAFAALPIEEQRRRLEDPDTRARMEALSEFIHARLDTRFGQDLASQAIQAEQEAVREEQGQRARTAAFEQIEAARAAGQEAETEQEAQRRARMEAMGPRTTLREKFVEAGVPEAVAKGRAEKQMRAAEPGFDQQATRRGLAAAGEKVTDETGARNAELAAMPLSLGQVMESAAPALKKNKLDERVPHGVKRKVADALQKRDAKGDLYRADQIARLRKAQQAYGPNSVSYGYVSTILDVLGANRENQKVDQRPESKSAAQPSATVHPGAAQALVQGNAPTGRRTAEVAKREVVAEKAAPVAPPVTAKAKEPTHAVDARKVPESRQPEHPKGSAGRKAEAAGSGNRAEQRPQGDAKAASGKPAQRQVAKPSEVPAAPAVTTLAEVTQLEKRQAELTRGARKKKEVVLASNLPQKEGESRAAYQQRVAREARKLIVAERKGKRQQRTSGPAATLLQQTQDRVAEEAHKRGVRETRQTAQELRREQGIRHLAIVAARQRGLQGEAALNAAEDDVDVLSNFIYKKAWKEVARAADRRGIDARALRIATGLTKIENAGVRSTDARMTAQAEAAAKRREKREKEREAALAKQKEREADLAAEDTEAEAETTPEEAAALRDQITRHDYVEPLVGSLNTNLEFAAEIERAKGDTGALLDWIASARSTTTPLQRATARRLRRLGLATKIEVSPTERGSHYYPAEDKIVLGADGQNILTFLHEMVHAATVRTLYIALGKVKGTVTPQQQAAVKELEKIWAKYKDLPETQFDPTDNKGPGQRTYYAGRDLYEFVAEAFSNPAVQELLKQRSTGNLWQRFVNAVRKLIGLPIKYSEMDRVVSLGKQLFSNRRGKGPAISLQREAAASPLGFVSALGRSIQEHSKVADKLVQSAGKADLSQRARKAILQVVTLNQMEEWSMRQVERWKRAFPDNPVAQKALESFSKAITKFFDAVSQKRQVKQGLDQESSSLLRQMEMLDGETKEYYVKSLGRRMTEFQMMSLMATESSRLGIDPTLQSREAAQKAGVDAKVYDSQYSRPEVQFLFELHDQLKDLHQKRSPNITEAKMFETARATAAVPKSGYEMYKLSAKLNELRYYQELSTQVRNMLRALDTTVYDEFAKRLDIRGPEQMYEVPLEGMTVRVDAFKKAIHDLAETIGGKNDKLLQALEGEYEPEAGEDRTSFVGWKDIAEKWKERFKAQAKKQDREPTEAEKARMERVERDVELLNTAGVLRANLNTIREQIRQRSAAPYFHLGRSGDYFVALRAADNPDAWAKISKAVDELGYVSGPKNAKGDRTVFLRFDTKQELALATAKFNPLLKDAIEPDSYRQGALEEKIWELDAADVLFVKRLQQSVNAYEDLPSETKNAMKRLINDTLIRLVPESSPRKAHLHREGRPGYNAELLHTYAMRQSAHNHVISTYYSAPQFDAAFGTMRESIQAFERNPDPVVAKIAPQLSAYETEMKERYSNLLSPVNSPILDKLRAFGHFWFLGLSPAYTAVNMLQPWHLTLPQLGGRFGFVNSFKALVRASRVAFAILKETVKQGWQGRNAFERLSNVSDARLIFEGPLRAAGLGELESGQYAMLISNAMQSGQLDFSQSTEIGRLAKGEVGALAKVAKIVTLFGHYSETFNRLTALMAAFDLAGKRTTNFDQRQRYALKTVLNTQLDYSDTNTARAFGRHGKLGAATPLFTSFQHYSFQVNEMMARLAVDSMAAPDQVENDLLMTKKEARKTLGQLFLTTSVISGVFGLPFASLAFALANAFGDDDDPLDARAKVREAFAGLLGKETGEILAHGIGRALGIEIGERAGLHDLLPGTRFLADRRQTSDAAKEGLMRAVGPAVSATYGIYQGVGSLIDGDYARAIQNTLPVVLRNPAKAAMLAARGVENRTSNDIPVELGNWDLFMQSLGFTPARKAEASGAAFYRRTEDMLLKQRQSSLRNKVYKAYEDQNWDEYFSTLDKLQAFETANPDYGMDIKRGLEARAKQRATAQYAAAPILDLPKFAPRLERYRYANTQ